MSFHDLSKRFAVCAINQVFDNSSNHLLQPWPLGYKRLLNKPYVNEVNLTGQKPPLKYCQYLEIQCAVRKKSRSFDAKNFGSVDQRAAKLLAVKVRGLKKKVCRPAPAPVSQSARV